MRDCNSQAGFFSTSANMATAFEIGSRPLRGGNQSCRRAKDWRGKDNTLNNTSHRPQMKKPTMMYSTT